MIRIYDDCVQGRVLGLAFSLYRDGFWTRCGSLGPGLQVTRAAPLFSERNGYDPPLLALGRWRLRRLRDLREHDRRTS